jgi:hypothetical protein
MVRHTVFERPVAVHSVQTSCVPSCVPCLQSGVYINRFARPTCRHIWLCHVEVRSTHARVLEQLCGPWEIRGVIEGGKGAAGGKAAHWREVKQQGGAICYGMVRAVDGEG